MDKSVFELAVPVLALPRAAKRFVVLSVDMSLCVLTVWLAFILRLGEFVVLSGTTLWAVGTSIGLALPIFMAAGLYRAIFRYSGWPALMTVGRAVGIYGLLYASIFTAIGITGIPRTVGIIQPILLLLFVGASRAFARLWLGDYYISILKRASQLKVLIYGAGSTGRQLAAAMANSYEMQVVGFLDDDSRLHGQVLNGQPIYSPVDLDNLRTALGVSNVLLAMPSISRQRRNDILSQIRHARVAVRTLPNVTDLAKGKVGISDLRELDIDDLLGRVPVEPDQLLLEKNIAGRVVLVTGAGGSIGSELCRQVLNVRPHTLLMIEQSEFALYTIHQELDEKLMRLDFNIRPRLVPLLASVDDESSLRKIMAAWQPGTVYHAAAYKHVPLVECNTAAGIKNNLMGTVCAARAAIAEGVSDFVLVSTDKAVRPTNVMGASKRLAEMALQALAATGPMTKFSMVRFGNVLGSSGSVIPRFRQQIREGGPITLTHQEVTRYFMTIPEAAQLVIQAGSMAKGGEVFLLDMGKPVKIADLAKRVVELTGLSVRDCQYPEGDIEIVVTGLRPGEKLYEELLIGDNTELTQHPSIMQAKEDFVPWELFETKLEALEVALSINDLIAIRSVMQELVAGYSPEDDFADFLHLQIETRLRDPGFVSQATIMQHLSEPSD